eukprot:GAHX01001920.1.p1 GENE.GAHX01001920.1~~GAHX01001920.1.p1  ORF type:complete len:228 (+),score=26.34 GAHX01001920.1:625-1308(+)
MHNFLIISFLLIGFLKQTEPQTESIELLFSHPQNNIKLPGRLRSSNYSDAFKLALIAMKVYSLVRSNKSLYYIKKFENFHRFSKNELSVFRSLLQFAEKDLCQVYDFYSKDDIIQGFEVQTDIVCTAKIKFRKVTKGYYINKLIEKSTEAIIATYLMRRMTEEGEFFVFELAVLLEIKKMITIENKIIYKCVYINTFNDIKTMYFKIEEGVFIGEDMFILEPWYYIE